MTFYVVLAVLLPWWLSRQRRQRAITPQRLISMPLIFAGIGALGLGHQDIPTDTAAAGYVAFSVTLSLLFGVWRGSLLPVWQTSAGKWMSQGNRRTVSLWVVLADDRSRPGSRRVPQCTRRAAAPGSARRHCRVCLEGAVQTCGHARRLGIEARFGA
jgi:hypothetical protein